MYLRETSRNNPDGSTVSYLQLAHNERNPRTGSPTAKVVHNFGRADKVDRDALKRLVTSTSRFLSPEQAATAAADSEVEILDSPPPGWGVDAGWPLAAAGHRGGDPPRRRGQPAGRRDD